MTMKLSNYLLPIEGEQEVTIDYDGGIIYEGKLNDWNIPMRELRNMEVINVKTSNCRVEHEIIIETKAIAEIK